MASLDHESARSFWQDFMGGSVYPIISFIEESEDWVQVNTPEMQESLDKLGQYLDHPPTGVLLNHLDLVKSCALLYMSQKLRIMQIVDGITPGCATKMISEAEKHASTEPLARIFLDRNIRFERMRILSRVLDSKRIKIVQEIYE